MRIGKNTLLVPEGDGMRGVFAGGVHGAFTHHGPCFGYAVAPVRRHEKGRSSGRKLCPEHQHDNTLI